MAGSFVAAAIIYGLLDSAWVRGWPAAWQAAYRLALLVALGVLVYRLTGLVLRWNEERRKLRQKLSETELLVSEAYQRLAAVFRIREEFAQADDEKEIVDLLLRNSVSLTGASGASFVPLDEHSRPLAAISYGNPPLPLPDAWVEYLASPAIHDRCKACENHNHLVVTCPLLQGPFSEAAGMYCIPLRRGEREFGVLNLYILDADRLNMETRAFLESLVTETAQALEAVWLRKRELGSLRQLQAVRQKADLNTLLASLLENVYHTLEPDFALLSLCRGEKGQAEPGQDIRPTIQDELVRGSLSPQARPYIESVLKGVLDTGEPADLNSAAKDSSAPPGVRSVLAVPLSVAENPALGVLLIGYRRTQSFQSRRLALLQTVAGQIALVVQNARQLAELEYQAMIEERTRLAREIHDGLAQTLGFLKLQVAQMHGHLERREFDRLRQAIRLYYETLSDAYQDARYAIDGLRISPYGSRMDAWLQQILAEFQENVEAQSLAVNMSCFDLHTDLASEVQAQLIRIVQEALSNVRKHAQASSVWVSCFEKDNELVIEIQDDGRGFLAEDVPGPSQHGLRGMRERAELIGADFQVISRPQQGTTVRISLPIKIGEIAL